MKAFCFGLGAALLATSAQAALTISNDLTSNVTCDGGVCAATAADAVLNVTDLAHMLAAGSLTVQSGSEAQDILVEAPFLWTSSNALTLDSYRAITVDKPVSDAGPAALNIAYNDGGTGGELLFRYKGRISFNSTKNALNINGQAYKLVKDIASLASVIAKNASGFYALKDNYNAKKDGNYGNTPITSNFNGSFEGLGNAISNFSINCRSDRAHTPIGLFAWVFAGGSIKGLKLDNIFFIDSTKKPYLAGGLVGSSSGYLFDDHVNGAITAKAAAGGLVGDNLGIISNSSAGVNIVSKEQSGGLAAGNGDGSTVTLSYATGEVSAPQGGGLIGGIGDAAVTNSYSTGNIQGKTADTGGFIGFNQTGTFVGQSYSTGKVPKRRGGFVGSATSQNFSDCYWDMQTSGTTDGIDGGNVAGITGLTSDQFKSGLPTGFDPSVWAQDKKINNGYPYLINNPPPK